MRPDRVRRMALAVAVVGAVGAIAASAGADPSPPSGPSVVSSASVVAGNSSVANAQPSDPGSTGPTGAAGADASAGARGASGATSSADTSGVTGSSGVSGAADTDGAPGATSGVTGASGPTGVPPASGATGASGASATSLPSGLGGAAEGVTSPPNLTGASAGTGAAGTIGTSTATIQSAAPAVSFSSPQPLGPPAAPGHGNEGASAAGSVGGSVNGPTAPSPALFAGADPLAGVLPGSWDDPFIVNGAADVPQFYVESFHIPPFLLPIYQAAGAAYDIPWQTLAAINEVETDYGTNLDVSSAGAIGWMQFLPSTWRRYGVDASASGARDPYNAADAIFAAARYLAAAGGTHNLPGAIFAYNHSRAYVQSVLLRAELLSGEPTALLNAVSQLAEGDFPIQLGYHAGYTAGRSAAAAPASGGVDSASGSAGATAPAPSAVGAAAAASAARTPATRIFASSGAAVVAAQDGTVAAIGHSRKLGLYVVLRNAFGDRFTYGHLASVSAWHPLPKPPRPSAALLSAAAPAALAPGPRPTAPATAGAQTAPRGESGSLFRRSRTSSAADTTAVIATINLGSRPSVASLFTPLAVLDRAATVKRDGAERSLLARYFTGAFGLRPGQLELIPMRVGSHVLAGTILGRLAHTTGTRRSYLIFELRPAGVDQLPIDARPFLDAWSQLETLELHRDSFNTPYYGPNLHASSVGTVLRGSQLDLERIVLEETHLTLPACERTAIAAGDVDRRVLASLEVLVLHGIDATVSGTWCSGSGRHAAPAVLKTGDAIALSALDGRSAATVASFAVRALGALPAQDRPTLSEQTVSGQLVISFAPAREPQALAAAASFTSGFALSAPRWTQLDARLGQIREPRVPTAISAAALTVARAAGPR